MSWSDREYGRDDDGRHRLGGPGGDWRGVRPSFDNPMTWSLRLGEVSGIVVRVHVIFVLFVVAERLRALFTSGGSYVVTYVAIMIACLFVIVLVHEFGHCLACRWAGGGADEILMWPLGGLAYCRPGHDWRSHFITAAGGPAVDVVFCLVCAPLLGLVTGRWLGVALPNPLDPYGPLAILQQNHGWAVASIFLFNWLSLVLLLFNLLPVFPLDGGRLLQSLLWPRLGYVGSMRVAVRVGYLGAIALGIYGIVSQKWMLVAIALFGGVTCYLTHRQMEYTEAVMAPDGEWAPGLDDDGDRPPSRAERRAGKRREKQEQRESCEAEEVDRILAKIAASGMDSITGTERRLLRKVSDRRRNQE